MFAYDGVKTEKQAREDFARIGGVGCEAVRSLYNMTRYLTHKDNADKAQYSSVDVLTFGGFEYRRYAKQRRTRRRTRRPRWGKFSTLCAEYGLYDFGTLADYLMTEEPDLFGVLRKNSYSRSTCAASGTRWRSWRRWSERRQVKKLFT